MPEENESPLERLERRLADPKDTSPIVEPQLSIRRTDIPRAWNAEPEPVHTDPTMPRPRKKLPVAVQFLIGAGIFFVAAGLLAAFLLFVGSRSVSTNNIAITVNGPTTAAGGDTVPLLITVENHNPVTISSASLSVEFPDGTRSPDDVTQPLTLYSSSLGDLAPGAATTTSVRAVLFGASGASITIPIKVEYQTAGSNATFVTEKDYVISLTSSPVSIDATSVSEISSGQPLTLSIAVRSNASKPLSDIAVLGTYPAGFAVSSTSIPSEDGLFPIGTLQPGQQTTLLVSGTLTGTNSDTQVFHWTVGSTASSTNGTISVPYTSTESDIAIAQPFLHLVLSLNGSTNLSSVSAGQTVTGILSWTNTLPTPVLDGKIVLSFGGSAVDPTSVSSQNGFYQSSDGTITFDSDTNAGLASLEPGDTGQGTFTFQIRSADQLAELHSPSVALSVSASGRRVDETGVPENLSATVGDTLKIASGLNLAGSILHTTGPFKDTGPWPPTPGTPTTYTVELNAQNGVNEVAGTVVTMTLPSYVTFTGQTNPADGSIVYTDSTRTVKWTIGDLGSGASSQAAFQVSFLPSVSQESSSPELVSAPMLTATDRFAQTTVTVTGNQLTTVANSDPAYQGRDGEVQ